MLKYRHTFTGEGEFRTWMYYLARHAAIDAAKKNSTQLHQLPPSISTAAVGPASTPAVALPDNEPQVILAGLASPSAMQRLQAGGQTRDLAPGNHKVAGALLRTLTQDPNVNVRLATLDALAPLGQDPVVRQGLVYALVRQESPLVQAALADVLVQLQLVSAVPKIKALLRQPDLNPAVRTKLERSLHTLAHPAALSSVTPSAHEIRASRLPLLALSLFSPLLHAQSAPAKQLVVALSAPDKPGFLQVKQVAGAIHIMGYAGKTVLVEATVPPPTARRRPGAPPLPVGCARWIAAWALR